MYVSMHEASAVGSKNSSVPGMREKHVGKCRKHSQHTDQSRDEINYFSLFEKRTPKLWVTVLFIDVKMTTPSAL